MLRPARRSSAAIPIAAPRALDLLIGISRSALRSLLLPLTHCLDLRVEFGCHLPQTRAQAHVLAGTPDRHCGCNHQDGKHQRVRNRDCRRDGKLLGSGQRRGNQHADAERCRQRGAQQRRAGGSERPDCGLLRVVPPPGTLSVLFFETAACLPAPRPPKGGPEQPKATGRSP